ncbi:MAG: hypothetical protein ABFS17_02005 [Chloroflexota bacterium]
MFSIKDITNPMNQIEDFYGVMDYSWQSLRKEFDVDSSLPDIKCLFIGVNLEDSAAGAEGVLINMLTEITERVHRFSPWYRCPARAYGLISLRDPATHKVFWKLAPEAVQRWQKILEPIECEIAYKSSLIEMIMTIDQIEFEPNQKSVLAICECQPPKELLVNQLFLAEEGVICNACQQNFSPLAA